MRFHETMARYAADVDAALAHFFGELKTQAARVDSSTLEMAEALQQFTCGPGKRLRPILMRVAYEGLGGTNTEAIIRASCAAELMQSFLLIHDDIMDCSELRRGRPTLHRWYHTRYSKQMRDSEHFGLAMAILAGDLSNQWAMLLLGQAPFAPHCIARALMCYNRIAIDVCYGQVLDMALPKCPLNDVREEDMWKVMEYKTARYTIEGPLRLGAILASADEEMLARLSAYGVPIGEAFQLRDDILGAFGEEARTGKSASSDLVGGKRTLLLVEAWKRASEEQRRALSQVLGNTEATAEEIEVAQRVLEDTGARAHVMQLAEARATGAKGALAGMPLAAPERQFLTELADYVVARER